MKDTANYKIQRHPLNKTCLITLNDTAEEITKEYYSTAPPIQDAEGPSVIKHQL